MNISHFCIHSSFNDHFGCFHSIMNNAAINMCVQEFVWINYSQQLCHFTISPAMYTDSNFHILGGLGYPMASVFWDLCMEDSLQRPRLDMKEEKFPWIPRGLLCFPRAIRAPSPISLPLQDCGVFLLLLWWHHWQIEEWVPREKYRVCGILKHSFQDAGTQHGG